MSEQRHLFFEKLPFNQIYHNSWLGEAEKQKIIASRHAEVIVPGLLDLEALRFIWCRSEAEKETLISFLSETPEKSMGQQSISWEKA